MRIFLSLGDQRPLADVLAELERSHGRVDIAQGGHTVAALVSAEYLESLEETISVATDAELVAAIAEGEAELEAGLGIPAHDVEADHSLNHDEGNYSARRSEWGDHLPYR